MTRAALRTGAWITPGRVRAYSVIMLTVGLLALAFDWCFGHGLMDRAGRPIGTDFADPYAAGHMALQGFAAEAYDYAKHHAEQRQLLGGGPAQPFYGWHYPPVFFLLAAPLALLPYLAALAMWLAATFAFCYAALRRILPQAAARWPILGFPAVFVTLGHGQNAFLSAGLLGLGLQGLETMPWRAGMLLGFLCYKPHLGLVVPVLLIAMRRWRALLSAGLMAGALISASLLAFGRAPWEAFLASGELTRRYVLEQGATGWYKLQTPFAALRSVGAPVEWAYAGQGIVAIAVLAGLYQTARRNGGPAAKALACLAALLVTPYALDYDLMLLAPALAFWTADGLKRGFAPHAATCLAGLWILPLLARPVAELSGVPLGPLALVAAFAFFWRQSRIAVGY